MPTLWELFSASAAGTPREDFCVRTLAIVIPVARIGQQRPGPGVCTDTEAGVVDIVMPLADDLGQETSNKPRTGTLGAPPSRVYLRIFRGGARQEGGAWRPEPLVHDAGAC